MSLGISGDAPQMYKQLEEKLGSGNNVAGLPDVRVAHYCPYKVSRKNAKKLPLQGELKKEMPKIALSRRTLG